MTWRALLGKQQRNSSCVIALLMQQHIVVQAGSVW
jgi:hypothetical protein